MTRLDGLSLAVAVFGAGMLNTVAGGGTFIAFPSLVVTGIPPVVANATSTVAMFPGYLDGALGLRHELGRTPRARLGGLALVTLAGGYARAPVARHLPPAVLRGRIAIAGLGMAAVFALRAWS